MALRIQSLVGALRPLPARCQEADNQALSNTAWAFAKCEVYHAGLHEAISGAAVRRVTEFVPQGRSAVGLRGSEGLSNLAWALARQGGSSVQQVYELAAMGSVSACHGHLEGCGGCLGCP